MEVNYHGLTRHGKGGALFPVWNIGLKQGDELRKSPGITLEAYFPAHGFPFNKAHPLGKAGSHALNGINLGSGTVDHNMGKTG
jgi:hypothetical protein